MTVGFQWFALENLAVRKLRNVAIRVNSNVTVLNMGWKVFALFRAPRHYLLTLLRARAAFKATHHRYIISRNNRYFVIRRIVSAEYSTSNGRDSFRRRFDRLTGYLALHLKLFVSSCWHGRNFGAFQTSWIYNNDDNSRYTKHDYLDPWCKLYQGRHTRERAHAHRDSEINLKRMQFRLFISCRFPVLTNS